MKQTNIILLMLSIIITALLVIFFIINILPITIFIANCFILFIQLIILIDD